MTFHQTQFIAKPHPLTVREVVAYQYTTDETTLLTAGVMALPVSYLI